MKTDEYFIGEPMSTPMNAPMYIETPTPSDNDVKIAKIQSNARFWTFAFIALGVGIAVSSRFFSNNSSSFNPIPAHSPVSVLIPGPVHENDTIKVIDHVMGLLKNSHVTIDVVIKK